MQIGNVNNTNLEYHGNIFISGLSAAGKTTHSFLLAGLFGLTYVSGSQIHLSINGLSPIQDRTFWITDRAVDILTKDQFDIVDKELCNIEDNYKGVIFDSWIMPWRKTKEGLCIYLKSNIQSRIVKGAISRRERHVVIDEEYANKLSQKDNAAINLYNKLYNIDISKDLSVFDLVIDISSFIETASFKSSQVSINKTQNILNAAVGYYLTGDKFYYEELKAHSGKQYIIKNSLL